MKFEHRDGEDAAGQTVSVSPHLKPEVDENGVFSVQESDLERRGVDPEAARDRLTEAGHTDLETGDQSSEESEDVADADSGSEDSESSEEEAATKTELMNLKKDQLVKMGETFDDIDTDQNKEPLAEDLVEKDIVLEGEE